ncbi:DUF1462 family protein [Sinobaca sp. H24]|uniref:DUF1462 family protein n=1 Tax=Sinobaca sp. H24 TaxID=2923376 RepID=UPI00207A56C4|nr:DUF1462 family protein [Sinobaca sp. H24]
MNQPITIKVYGSEEKCSGCVQLPSSIETKEWLEAALQRKYPDKPLDVVYVDMHQPNGKEEEETARDIIENNRIYPLVLVNGDIIAEGNPRLKKVYEYIEKLPS